MLSLRRTSKSTSPRSSTLSLGKALRHRRRPSARASPKFSPSPTYKHSLPMSLSCCSVILTRIGALRVSTVLTYLILRLTFEIALNEAIKADHGFNVESRAIHDLLDVMSEYDLPTRRSYLQFITGSPRLPVGGELQLLGNRASPNDHVCCRFPWTQSCVDRRAEAPRSAPPAG